MSRISAYVIPESVLSREAQRRGVCGGGCLVGCVCGVMHRLWESVEWQLEQVHREP